MDSFDLINSAPGDAGAIDALRRRTERLVLFTRTPEDYAGDYVATPPLITAVNVALSLGRPLLLTGEPGSGKTLAARWIALKLGLAGDRYLEFQVRSESRARDLRYEFDAVSWFRTSQLAAAAGEPGQVLKADFISPRALGRAFGWDTPALDRPYVVLIDEIDKAPRDFPNDLLLELDQMRFVIEETGRQIGPPGQRPIIVITSNAERRLPDPFLRRCVIHNIELDDDTVMKILGQRLKDLPAADRELLAAATVFWNRLKVANLNRKLSIAEFWQWLALATKHGEMAKEDLQAGLRGPVDAAKLPLITSLLTAADLNQIRSAI